MEEYEKHDADPTGKFRALGWLLMIAIAAVSVAFLLERFGLPFEMPWNVR
jgi:hypothetical protein